MSDTTTLHLDLDQPPLKGRRRVDWDDDGVSLVTRTLPEFKQEYRRASRKERRKAREWYTTSLSLLLPRVDEGWHLYALGITYFPGPEIPTDPWTALDDAMTAVRRCGVLDRCVGILVRHGGAAPPDEPIGRRNLRPHLHAILASPEPLSRDERERVRAIAKRRAGGFTRFESVYFRHGLTEVNWPDLDPCERRITVEQFVLYLLRRVLELPQGSGGPVRRFERIGSKRAALVGAAAPWSTLAQVTEATMPFGSHRSARRKS